MSLPKPAAPSPGPPATIRLGLETIRPLLARLGQPQHRVPVVLVAGTNGKGSTAALLAAMASAAGYRTGLFTSPHLETLEDSLRLDGCAVAPGRLGDLMAEVAATAADPPALEPTAFEALTAAAYLFLARERVDLAVVEVGLGGRDDATNAAEPILSIITSISLDHAEHLGLDLGAVARSKAGVLRRGRRALAWPQAAAAREALRHEAAQLGAELTLGDGAVAALVCQPRSGGGQEVELATGGGRYRFEITLSGEHQGRNLALAVLAAEALAGAGFPRLDATAMAHGAAACRWPGRCEEIVLPGGRPLLLDAAHNPEGAAALVRYLDARGEPFQLLFGALAGKEAASMLPPLARRAHRTLLTRVPGASCWEPTALAHLVPAATAVAMEGQLDGALDRALAASGALVVVCGSLRLVGHVRLRLRQRHGLPPAATDPIYAYPAGAGSEEP